MEDIIENEIKEKDNVEYKKLSKENILEKTPFYKRYFNILRKNIDIGFFFFLIICFLSHFELIINNDLVKNRLDESIFESEIIQLFNISDNNSLIKKFFGIIMWKRIIPILCFMPILFFISNTLMYYFSTILLNRFSCLIYIIFMVSDIFNSFPIYIYMCGIGIIPVIYFIIRIKKHKFEEEILKIIPETKIFHPKYFIKFIAPLSLLIFPYIFIMYNILYNLFLNNLLFNNKSNIAILSHLILNFLFLKFLICFIKYYIIYFQNDFIIINSFNFKLILKAIKNSLLKTYEFSFFLITLKLLFDLLLRILLFYPLISIKSKLVFKILFILIILIQFGVSSHKTIFMTSNVIWDKYSNIFYFNKKNSKRRFYIGRNILFYIRNIKNDLLKKNVWNIETRVVLFHASVLHIFWFISSNFFSTKEYELIFIKKKLVNNLNNVVFENFYKGNNNIPNVLFINPLSVYYKRLFIRFFLLTPYLFLMIFCQTGLISSIIFKDWVYNNLN